MLLLNCTFCKVKATVQQGLKKKKKKYHLILNSFIEWKFNVSLKIRRLPFLFAFPFLEKIPLNTYACFNQIEPGSFVSTGAN